VTPDAAAAPTAHPVPTEAPSGRSVLTPWHSAAALAALLLSLAAVHLWWLDRFRRGFPLDIDESGYLWFSFVQHEALREDGPLGLFREFQGEGWVGPLLPSITAFLELPGGSRQIVPSIAVQLLFLAVLVLASYGIGSRLLDRRAGLLTAVVVATTPAILDFVRTYHLVIPSAAMYSLATYALLASDRLRRRSWAVGWGVALGLTLLSRSMIVAFLPALVLAAVWVLVVDRADVRRIGNLVLGLAALTGTTLLWYATSWRPIFDYLTSFGYGAESPGHAGRTPFSIGFWTDELVGTVDLSLYLPLAAVILAVLALGAIGGLLRLVRSPSTAAALRAWSARAARSDAIVPGFVVAEGYLALTSSSNDGTGFVVPLLPSLIALVVVVALRLPWRRVRVGLVAALSVVAVFNVVMKADVVTPVSEARTVDVPLFGRATLTNGRGFFHQHLVNDACYELGPPTRWLPDSERGWLVAFREAVSPLAGVRRSDREPRMYLALSEPVLNTSAVRLAAIRDGHQGGVFEKVDTGGDDTVDAYRRLLAAAMPDLLVTASREGCHFGPPITQRLVEGAAVSLGYRPVRRLPLPDGRQLRVWAAQPPKRTS
jgi:Dolichyl-phosphate-mannose-protein mannosyltransferase